MGEPTSTAAVEQLVRSQDANVWQMTMQVIKQVEAKALGR